MDAVQALADDVVVYLDESTGELAVGIRLEVDLAGVLLTGGDLVELGMNSASVILGSGMSVVLF